MKKRLQRLLASNGMAVVYSVLILAGFFMLIGTGGAIERLPMNVMPGKRFLVQVIISVVVGGVGGLGLHYHDNSRGING